MSAVLLSTITDRFWIGYRSCPDEAFDRPEREQVVLREGFGDAPWLFDDAADEPHRERVPAFGSVKHDSPERTFPRGADHGDAKLFISKGLWLSRRNPVVMDEAAATRRAALDAVEDVKPDRLRDRIAEHVRAGSMVPGVVTILSVRAATDGEAGGATTADDTLFDAVERRAAGVQLIYDGLRLTRQLSHDEPWRTGGKETGNLDVLVADVLVARGFYLLSRTEAAETAVETVRAFGHDQTLRETDEDPALDRNLEADVVRLAIVAGAGLRETALSPGVTELATTLAGEFETQPTAGFLDVENLALETLVDRLAAVTPDSGVGEGLTTSVDD